MPSQDMAQAALRQQLQALTSTELHAERLAPRIVVAVLWGIDRCGHRSLGKLFALAVAVDDPFEELPPDTLRNLNSDAQQAHAIAQEAGKPLVLPVEQGNIDPHQDKSNVNYYQSTWCNISGLLHRKRHLYVLPTGVTRKEILHRNHDNPVAGHFT